jgi:hypothetical protein
MNATGIPEHASTAPSRSKEPLKAPPNRYNQADALIFVNSADISDNINAAILTFSVINERNTPRIHEITMQIHIHSHRARDLSPWHVSCGK